MESKGKKVLLLGSGLMSGAVIDYLLKREENHITIASNILADAQKLCSTRKRCEATFLDIENETSLRELIRNHDLVLSMIPAILQGKLAKPCLEEGKNLVTSSYTKKEMLDMNDEVAKKGLTFLNECGLDPGIDHMTAMKIIDETHSEGGKVLEFESFCGGLVSPEFCDNPYGYKFSWSPIGALRSLKNDALFLQDGKETKIAKENLMFESKKKDICMALSLEGYPNRDSLGYKDVYGLKDIKTLVRGTLRYGGFTLLARSLIELGLIEEDPVPENVKASNWREFLSNIVANVDKKAHKISEDRLHAIFSKVNLAKEDWELATQIFNKIFANNHYDKTSEDDIVSLGTHILKTFKWTGFFDKNAATSGKTFIETTCALLEKKLALKAGEKDLIVLQHRFVIENKDKQKIVKTSSIIKIGEVQLSAMAACVGFTVAIGAQLVLDGVINKKGVIIPNTKDIYEPMLELLQKEGIYAREETE